MKILIHNYNRYIVTSFRAWFIKILLLITLIACPSLLFPNQVESFVGIEGVIDLKGKNFNDGTTLSLDGQWEFYWGKFIAPEDFSKSNIPDNKQFIKVPGIWNSKNQDLLNISASGFATYRMTLKNLGDGNKLALKIPLIGTAYIIYVNGLELGRSGTPGKIEATTIPHNDPRVYDFLKKSDSIEIVLHISNFHHRVGGIWNHIEIGSEISIRYEESHDENKELFIAGCIFMLGLYYLSLFMLGRLYISPLFFSIFCMIITVRSFVTGSIPILNYINIPWEYLVKIEYLTYYLGFPAFIVLLRSLFPNEVEKKFVNIVITVSALFSFLVIITQASIYSYSMFYYQLFSFGASMHLLWFLILAVAKKRDSSWIFLHSVGILFLCMINDILDNDQIIDTMQVFPFGVMYLILSQSVIISKRFLGLLNTVEHQKDELKYHRQDLESRVKERTALLEDANRKLQEISLRDGLTKVANRRMFDQYLTTECKRMRRTKGPISLLMCDIDYFKQYNDTYGHQKGDECLIKVANKLHKSTQRVSDVVGRYGGEEFGVILPNTPKVGAVILANKLRTAISDLKIPHELSTVSEYISVSIGVATINPISENAPELLIKKSDGALYDAKWKGRNRVVFDSKETDSES
ncbi:MAG: diguanylate cyclase [Candidatus Marinimicrobia bacterium]|nr:diguanylate cyclase [Candidatus Neomarinimicrobiota bacterium]MBT3634339.1 diguanylate cyclase [Candidatus Neomarinimicrobiota bacterium]MBT3681752.1 diguanylate cyclase [Candidatus Neomarinimicrobiota bacterium]MBT3759478.1 diguanylate cyclase [Candidatus Neomarinimicrobiota bacterium]MBT3895966.1 diguanylate cyclase [Candidatus Neomarinimicrobiota bacterium]